MRGDVGEVVSEPGGVFAESEQGFVHERVELFAENGEDVVADASARELVGVVG